MLSTEASRSAVVLMSFASLSRSFIQPSEAIQGNKLVQSSCRHPWPPHPAIGFNLHLGDEQVGLVGGSFGLALRIAALADSSLRASSTRARTGGGRDGRRAGGVITYVTWDLRLSRAAYRRMPLCVDGRSARSSGLGFPLGVEGV